MKLKTHIDFFVDYNSTNIFLFEYLINERLFVFETLYLIKTRIIDLTK